MKSPHPTQVRQAVALLREVLRRERPADVLLAEHFRAHRTMGGRDRAHLGNLLYGVLRHQRALRAAVGESPEALIAAALMRQYAVDDAALARYGLSLTPAQHAALATPPADAAVLDNLPPDLAAVWPQLLPEAEWRPAAQALQQPAPADFRVNRLRLSRDTALAALQTRDIEAAPTPFAPDGLRLARRLPQGDPLLRDGSLEPQDEGSQWLVACLPLRAGESVLDYCAGAGGKALALAAALGGTGQVTATDIDPARLARLPPRAARAGAVIDTHTLPLPPEARFDGVLVDAPCSGSGTLRRSPERSLDRPDLDTLHQLQRSVLDAAAQHVTDGGWLVYATCSLHPQENEAVADAFAAAHPDFTPWALALPGGGQAPQLRLWPHRHGTDGYFAAGFRRRGPA